LAVANNTNDAISTTLEVVNTTTDIIEAPLEEVNTTTDSIEAPGAEAPWEVLIVTTNEVIEQTEEDGYYEPLIMNPDEPLRAGDVIFFGPQYLSVVHLKHIELALFWK
jgi:hypothetical protein